jgi:hypothetical protein
LELAPFFHSKTANASSETMSLAYCAIQLKNAVTCVQADPNTCGECFEDVGEQFEETLAYNVEMEFRQTLAFIPATDPGFCAESNARMCTYERDRMVSPLQLEHTGAKTRSAVSRLN